MSELRLREEDLSWRQIDAEIVAVDVTKSTYLSANESGAVLWSLLVDGATRTELATALEDRYGIDRGRAEADADAFVAALESRGLLRP
jgi:coenzyme PQQ synthesis protein D (PqqD)